MKSLFSRKKTATIQKKIIELKKTIEEMEFEENLQKEIEINEKETNTIKENIEVGTEENNKEFNEEKEIKKIEPVMMKEVDQKQIVKDEILKIIKEKNLTSKEIKKEVVDTRKICSKASYYRYLQELKSERAIETIKINQEEFLYKKQ